MSGPSDVGLAPFMAQGLSFGSHQMQEQVMPIRVVRRSWTERLFSRPWRPLDATRIEHSPQPPVDRLAEIRARTIAARESAAREERRRFANMSRPWPVSEPAQPPAFLRAPPPGDPK